METPDVEAAAARMARERILAGNPTLEYVQVAVNGKPALISKGEHLVLSVLQGLEARLGAMQAQISTILERMAESGSTIPGGDHE